MFVTTKFGTLTHAGRVVYTGGQPRPYPKSGAQRSQISQILGPATYTHKVWPIYRADLLNDVRTVWPRTNKMRQDNTLGRVAYFYGSATPLPQGAVCPRLPNFGGSLLFMCTPFDAELPNFDAV